MVSEPTQSCAQNDLENERQCAHHQPQGPRVRAHACRVAFTVDRSFHSATAPDVRKPEPIRYFIA